MTSLCLYVSTFNGPVIVSGLSTVVCHHLSQSCDSHGIIDNLWHTLVIRELLFKGLKSEQPKFFISVFVIQYKVIIKELFLISIRGEPCHHKAVDMCLWKNVLSTYPVTKIAPLIVCNKFKRARI